MHTTTIVNLMIHEYYENNNTKLLLLTLMDLDGVTLIPIERNSFLAVEARFIYYFYLRSLAM